MPASLDSKASDPPGSPPEVTTHVQSETSIVTVPDESASDATRIVLAYNDFTYSDNNDLATGVSQSADRGLSWTRANLPFPQVACRDVLPTSDAACVTRISGDPWVSQEDGTVYYTALAETCVVPPAGTAPGPLPPCTDDVNRKTDAIVVSRSVLGGPFEDWQVVSWDPAGGQLYQFVPTSGIFYDKPSSDTRDGLNAIAWTVYDAGNFAAGTRIRLATRDIAATAPVWSVIDLTLPVPDGEAGAGFKDPIVKIVSGREILLSTFYDAAGGSQSDTRRRVVEIYRLTKGSTGRRCAA